MIALPEVTRKPLPLPEAETTPVLILSAPVNPMAVPVSVKMVVGSPAIVQVPAPRKSFPKFWLLVVA